MILSTCGQYKYINVNQYSGAYLNRQIHVTKSRKITYISVCYGLKLNYQKRRCV